MGGDTPGAKHLGLDLGGTNIKWAVLGRGDGDWRVLDRDHIETRGVEGPDAVIQRMATVAKEAIQRNPGVRSVGIGVPGSYDPRAGATLFLTNVHGDWNGKPVASVVGDTLGLPVHLINDARAFGLAELQLGAGRGAATMVGLALGTGLGGVIALDGGVHEGHDGTAGEIGHETIEPNGPMCSCGNQGCLEAFVKAEAIAARCGASSAEDALIRARAGDRRAAEGMAEVGRYLGIGIANMVSVFTPDRVVIGGGGGTASFDLLIGPIKAELVRRVHLTPLDRVEIVPAELGVWAGAIGAALHGAEAAAARPEAAAPQPEPAPKRPGRAPSQRRR
jgi:glucokinase